MISRADLEQHGAVGRVFKLDLGGIGTPRCRGDGSPRSHHAAVQLHLQHRLEARDDVAVLLHVRAEHHVNHQFAQPHLRICT